MLHIIWYILCSLSRREQENFYFTAWLALVGFFFSSLLTLVVLLYRGLSAALFHEYSAIMLGLIIDVLPFTAALAAWVLATSNRNSRLFLKSVSYFGGFGLWLAPLHLWTDLGVGHFWVRCIHSCIFTLWFWLTDFWVLPRISPSSFKLVWTEIPIEFWVLLRKSPISFKLVQTEILTNFQVLPRKSPIIFELVRTEIPIPINFPRNQWIFHAYS